MRVELDHLQLAAPSGCEPAARAFYGGLLGLTELAEPPALSERGGVWFALADGGQLHVGVVPVAEFTPATKAHPGLRVSPDDLHVLAEALLAAGHPVVWADPAEIPGRVRLHTTDPWGNRLELLATPAADPG
jgi:catechol 2,3-dioxygenase-like lactoylglutathione lyase family enzyme